jgi:pimeloyl-ACP methyl ester carboxylesterase
MGLLLVLAAAVVLLAPFLVSQQPAPAAGSAAEALKDARRLRIAFPGTAGIELHYRERGTRAPQAAPVFLLLHGFTFSLFTWDPVFERFAARARTVAYDQIPYGLSAKLRRGDWSGMNPYAKEAAIDQLFSLMDGLGIERAILVGSSSGGTLAMEAALERPQRVEGLILIAPWVYAQRPTFPAWFAELPQMRRLSLLIGRKLGEGVLLDYSYADPGRVTEARRTRMLAHTAMAGWDLAWGELLTRSLYSPVEVSRRLAEITQPVLLVSGDTDKLVPVGDSRRVADQLPNGSLQVLEGCGHVPHEECPEAFWQAVSQWLTDRKGEGADAVVPGGGGPDRG